jgi:hypothetical protein
LVIRLRPRIREALGEKGIEPRTDDTAESLKERLNDAYLVEVRRLRDRQRKGEIPLADYAARAEELKQSFALLGLPLHLWEEPSGSGP